MITYSYWAIVIGLAGAVLFGLRVKGKKWKPAAVISMAILVIGWGCRVIVFAC